jgi:succinate dehydrogenase / fumarate reductase membrane anchor subunit
METSMGPKKGEGAWLWLAKIASGALLILVLIVHMIVNHLVAEGGLLTYADVVAYFSNPWVVAMEIFFLVFVVSHALMGLRSVLLDLNPARGFLKAVNALFVVVGIGAVIYGVWLALEIASRSAGA